MSYNCEDCGTHVPHGTKAKKVVTETRKKIYPGGSVGHEIVTEKILCKQCERKANVCSTSPNLD